MRHVTNVLVVAMLAAPALVLGSTQDASKVLADMKVALGGAEKLSAVKTLTATGQRTSSSGASTENEFELAVELPDKYMISSVLANMGTMSVYRNTGFNGSRLINVIDQPPMLGDGGGGGTVFVRSAGAAGVTTPTAEQKAKNDRQQFLVQNQDFARLTLGMFGSSFPACPLEFAYGGEAEAADGKEWVLDVKGAGDFTARLFVDTGTKLPLMLSWMALEPAAVQQNISRSGTSAGTRTMQAGGGTSFSSGSGAKSVGQMTPEERKKLMDDLEAQRKAPEANRMMVEYRVYYSDFKTVGGIKLPHKFERSVDGRPTEEMTFDQIRLNPRIDPRKFEISK